MEKRIIKELESKDGESRVFLYMLIIISVIVIFFGTVITIGLHKNNSISNVNLNTEYKHSKNLKNKTYKISTDSGKISGIAKISKKTESKTVKVDYFLHIKEELPANKKCFKNNNDKEENCRWIDFYNYVVSINDGIGGNNKNVSGRLYPMFCSSFSDLTKSDSLYDAYTSCWQGKTKKQYHHTDKYFVKISAIYNTMSDFLSHNNIDIFDAKDYTERTNITKNKMTTSTELVNKEKAIKNGKKIKGYEFKITQ